MTLRVRICLLVVLAVAPAFGLLVFNHQRSLAYGEEQAELQALRSTLLISAELEQMFKGVESLLRAAGQTPMVSGLERKPCSEYLARLEELNASSGLIIAANNLGVVKCASSSAVDSIIADRDYFSAALESGELVVGTHTLGRSSGLPVLPVAIRIQTVEGVGILAAGLRLDWIRNHFVTRFSQLPPNSSLTIVDRNGIILVRLPNFDREGQPLVNYGYVVNAPQPGTFRSAADKNADGIARFLGAKPLSSPPRGVAIAVGHPQEPMLAEVRATAFRNYMLLTLAAMLALAAAAFGGHFFIHRPLSELLRTIDLWRNQNLNARVAVAAADQTEFGQLGRSFNAMADRLQGALVHKDILLRELSHRVMNSLQMMSALFRLQSKSVLDPAARAQFEHAVGRVDAIALTYRHMQTIDGIERIDISEYLHALCSGLEKSLMNGHCIVKASSLLLSPKQAVPISLIVNELVTNAVKHGKCGEPTVEIHLANGTDQCRLSVSTPGDLPTDYRKNATGFGMQMVDSMVQQLGGALQVTSNDGVITFTVMFSPLDPNDAACGTSVQ